jgi:hypothetical protein
MNPIDTINYIIQQFNLIEDNHCLESKNLPKFISEFLNNIKFKLEIYKSIKEQKQILKEYYDKPTFMNYLEQRINDSINCYFGISNGLSSSYDSDSGFISE